MVNKLNLKKGDYRILDNGFHQYKSFIIYKIIDIKNEQCTLEIIIKSVNLDPYADYYDSKFLTVGLNYAIIKNSEPIDNKKVFDTIFGTIYEWEII